MRSLTMAAGVCALILPGCAAAQGSSVLAFSQALGGTLVKPVDAAPYVYVGTGAIVTAYDYSVPAAPVVAGSTGGKPVRGWITGLTRRGDFLYAGWTNYQGGGGVAVYSIADRAHPKLLGQYDDYTQAAQRAVQGLVARNAHLYLFDGNNGVFAGDLSKKAKPVFSATALPYYNYQYQEPFVQGDRIYMAGRDFIDDATLQIYGVKTPEAPVLLGTSALDGFANFRLKIAPPYALGFGTGLTVTDVSKPAQMTPRGSVSGPFASNGFVAGTYGYGVGGKGIDIYSFADPDAPAFVRHSAVDAFAADQTINFGTGALTLTETDQVLDVDVSRPKVPRLVSAAPIAGGVAPADLAFAGGDALIAEPAYGFGVADGATLAPLGRFDAGLPQSLQSRDIDALVADGDVAYAAAWGYGLIIADVTTPAQPVALGRLPYFGPNAIEASGGFVYLGKQTNGGEFAIVDARTPAKPVLRGRLAMNGVGRIQVSGSLAFVADTESSNNGGGLRVVDVSRPDAPAQIGFFNGAGCTGARDIALDTAAKLAYLACNSGLLVVDVSDPAAPSLRGGTTVASQAVARLGTRVFAGNAFGFDELDVSDPARPVRVKRFALPYPPTALRTAADGRLFVLDGLAGLYVYDPAGT